ncbi:hypothetical protein J6590_086980 [Homalodisca vitripennis]|nr:hypothetical protein J6590_086980 [Homalodisca vitripennis]
MDKRGGQRHDLKSLSDPQLTRVIAQTDRHTEGRSTTRFQILVASSMKPTYVSSKHGKVRSTIHDSGQRLISARAVCTTLEGA